MKSKVKTSIQFLSMLLIFAGLITSCSDDDDTDVSSNEGSVAVELTDDPFPMSRVSAANIGVAKIELKDSEGNYVTVFEGNSEVNMVNYTNGATAEVTVNTVPEGSYVEARITLSDASVDLSDGTHFDASVSTSQSYSVQISPAVEVSAEQNESLLLDLDLSDSFEFEFSVIGDFFSDITGISSFEPDFRAVCLSKTGSVEGTVTDENGEAVAYAYVETEYDYNGDGEAESVSTIADANGHYAFIGLPEGSYEVKVETENGEGSAEVSVAVQQTATVDITANASVSVD